MDILQCVTPEMIFNTAFCNSNNGLKHIYGKDVLEITTIVKRNFPYVADKFNYLFPFFVSHQ